MPIRNTNLKMHLLRYAPTFSGKRHSNEEHFYCATTGSLTKGVNIMSLQFGLGESFTIEWLDSIEDTDNTKEGILIASPQMRSMRRISLICPHQT